MTAEYSFQELKQKLFGKVSEVYSIFRDYFGEPYVDLQGLPDDKHLKSLFYNNYHKDTDKYKFISEPSIGLSDDPFIMVWWPAVTVTNEYDRSVNIEDLYAKIPVSLTGLLTDYGGFTLNRSTYSLLQYSSGYLHSHINGIPFNPAVFASPCLGKGPIKNTIYSLRGEFDSLTWMLFCNELAAYVTVESVSGVPYRRLERIGGQDASSNSIKISNRPKCSNFCRIFSTYTLKDFILYYLKNGHLKFNYSENAYSLGMSYYDYIIDVSNSFIDYYNTNLKDSDTEAVFNAGILKRKIVSDGKICNLPSDSDVNLDNIGSYVCTFKGKEIYLTVHDTGSNDNLNTSILLDNSIASNILQSILTILNYRYADNKIGELHYDPNTGKKLPASTGKTVRYI